LKNQEVFVHRPLRVPRCFAEYSSQIILSSTYNERCD